MNNEHTSVTINAGQTTILNGVGCLVEGAEFTVKYYNALYDKVSDLPQKATRTWVLKTIK